MALLMTLVLLIWQFNVECHSCYCGVCYFVYRGENGKQMCDNSIVCCKYVNLKDADVNVVLEGCALCLMKVGFTVSQATKALRESTGIALFYF